MRAYGAPHTASAEGFGVSELPALGALDDTRGRWCAVHHVANVLEVDEASPANLCCLFIIREVHDDVAQQEHSPSQPDGQG